jgi:hypothetical protein
VRGPSAPTPLSLKDWFAFVSPIILATGLLIATGAYIAQVKDNSRRIDAIEERNHQVDLVHDNDKDKLNTIDVRTARIESKLEILLPAEKVTKP